MSNGAGQKSSSSTTFHLLAGLASGFTSSILLQPADLLKTRVQQSGSHSLLASLKEIVNKPRPIRQLWRGTLPSCLRTSVGSALYLTTLNALRTNLASRKALASLPSSATNTTVATPAKLSSSTLPQLTLLGNLTSGAIARASVGFIMMPITVIKVRYESNYYNYTSILSAARDIGGKEGLRGFFAGFGATALRDAPYAGLYVVFYEQGKRVLSGLASPSPHTAPAPFAATMAGAESRPLIKSEGMRATTSASINFLSSLLAASLSTAITNPPDAIKTRLQLQPTKYRNTLQALRLMMKEEGMRSFFDGLALRMVRKGMSSALAWTVYEEVVRRAEMRLL